MTRRHRRPLSKYATSRIISPLPGHDFEHVRFGVMSAPTLVLIRDGGVVWQATGARIAARLREDLAPYLA